MSNKFCDFIELSGFILEDQGEALDWIKPAFGQCVILGCPACPR